MPIVTGILLGLSTLIFIGPVFFYLLKSSFENGFKSGLSVALGIIVGDIICVLLAIYGFGEVLSNPIYTNWMAGIGGAILLFFGIQYLFFSGKMKKHKTTTQGKSLVKHFINGFLINFVNPFVFAVWFGFYALAKSKYKEENQVILVLIITLCVIFITDILKAYFANKLNNLITHNKLQLIYRIIGIIMIIFSIRLLLEILK